MVANGDRIVFAFITQYGVYFILNMESYVTPPEVHLKHRILVYPAPLSFVYVMVKGEFASIKTHIDSTKLQSELHNSH